MERVQSERNERQITTKESKRRAAGRNRSPKTEARERNSKLAMFCVCGFQWLRCLSSASRRWNENRGTEHRQRFCRNKRSYIRQDNIIQYTIIQYNTILYNTIQYVVEYKMILEVYIFDRMLEFRMKRLRIYWYKLRTSEVFLLREIASRRGGCANK